MKLHFVILLLFFGFQLNAQSICNPIGNLAVFSNYDGGILTINVDQNIPNLKIGICAACHPFFTGEQKFIDTAGRVEKFSRRYGSVHATRAVNTVSATRAQASKLTKKK